MQEILTGITDCSPLIGRVTCLYLILMICLYLLKRLVYYGCDDKRGKDQCYLYSGLA